MEGVYTTPLKENSMNWKQLFPFSKGWQLLKERICSRREGEKQILSFMSCPYLLFKVRRLVTPRKRVTSISTDKVNFSHLALFFKKYKDQIDL